MDRAEGPADQWDHCEWMYWLPDGRAAGRFGTYAAALQAMCDDERVNAEDDGAHLRPYCTRCGERMPHFWGKCKASDAEASGP